MRKKILLTVVVMFSVFVASAQLEKGKLYADLSIGQRVLRANTWHVRPGMSLALSEKFAIGVFGDYTRHTRFETMNGSGYMNKYAAGIAFSYFNYFSKARKWGWYMNADIQYNHSELFLSESYYTTLAFESNTVELNLTPGIFFTTRKFLFYGNVGGYSLSKSIYRNEYYKSFDFGSQLNLGMKMNLGRKRK
jgi:hypothetical protein